MEWRKNNNSARRWQFVCMQNNLIAAHLSLAIFGFTISCAMNSKPRVRIQGEFYIKHSYKHHLHTNNSTEKKHTKLSTHTHSRRQRKSQKEKNTDPMWENSLIFSFGVWNNDTKQQTYAYKLVYKVVLCTTRKFINNLLRFCMHLKALIILFLSFSLLLFPSPSVSLSRRLCSPCCKRISSERFSIWM